MGLAAGRAGLLHDHAQQLMQLLEVDATVGCPKDTLDVARLNKTSREFTAGTTEAVERRGDRRHTERGQIHRRRRRQELDLGRLDERPDLGSVLANERGEAFFVDTHDLFETFSHLRAVASTLDQHGPQTVRVALGVAEVVLEVVVSDKARADDEQRLTNSARQVHHFGDVVPAQVKQQTQSRHLFTTSEVVTTPPLEHGGRTDLAVLAELCDVPHRLELVNGVCHQVLKALNGRAGEAHRSGFRGFRAFHCFPPFRGSELAGLELRGTASLAGIEPADEEVLQVRGNLLAAPEFPLDEGPVDAGQLAPERCRDLQEQRVTAVPEVLVVSEQQRQCAQKMPTCVLRPRALSLEGEALVGEAEERLDVPDERLLSVLDGQDADVVDRLRNGLFGAAVDGGSHLQHHLEGDQVVRPLVLVILYATEQRELLGLGQLRGGPGLVGVDERPDGHCGGAGDEVVAHPDLRPDLGVAVVELVEDLALQLVVGVDVDDDLEPAQLVSEAVLLGLEGRGDALETIEQGQRTSELEAAGSVELTGSDLDVGAAEAERDRVGDALVGGHRLDQLRLLGTGTEQHVALVVRHEHGLVLRGLEVARQHSHGLAVQRFLALDSTRHRGGGDAEPAVGLIGEKWQAGHVHGARHSTNTTFLFPQGCVYPGSGVQSLLMSKLYFTHYNYMLSILY